MKGFRNFLVQFVASFSVVILVVLAQALAQAVDPGTVVVADGDFLMKLWQSLGGLAGMGAGALAVLIVQLLMMASQTSFAAAKIPGKWRLLMVYGLSLILVPLSLHFIGGLPWLATILHAQTFAAAQVFVQNIIKQFFSDKGNAPVSA